MSARVRVSAPSSVSDFGSLSGRSSRGSLRNEKRAGSGIPSPMPTTSLVPSEGIKERRFCAVSDTAERRIDWSSPLPMRMKNKVLH